MSKIRPVALALLLAAGSSLAACAGPDAGVPPSPAAETPEQEAISAPAIAAQPAPEELLRNGKTPFEGILTGGQPTPEQLVNLRDLGYRTIVNLRRPEEEGSTDPDLVASLGMTYVSIPVDGAQGVTETNARRLAEVLESAGRPVVVHCASGNRVGAIFAMKAFHVDGRSPEEALTVGRAAGVTRLEPVVRERLGLPATG